MSELLHLDTLPEITMEINKQDKVLVEFGAPWCAPCTRFLPHFEKFAKTHNDIVCVKVNIDKDPDVMAEFGIQSVPQVMLFENGRYIHHVNGRTILQLNQELYK